MTANRWKIVNRSIVWPVVPGDVHTDHLEMSGQQVSLIVTYGQDPEGRLILNRRIIYPLLRTIPNNTHASTIHDYNEDFQLQFLIDGQPAAEHLCQVIFDGVLALHSRDPQQQILIRRLVFPDPEQAAAYEHLIIQNTGAQRLHLTVPPISKRHFGRGGKGVYVLDAACAGLDQLLEPGESVRLDCFFTGYVANSRPAVQAAAQPAFQPALEALNHRYHLIRDLSHKLVLETPDATVDQAFFFAKIRACESIFKNQCGLLHSPGGGSYYAAIWTNDEIEYAGPFFPFVGFPVANEASINAYQLFIPFMSDNFQAIPTSIIAEGQSIWEGAGDRGDAAMYLYGLARFLLAGGDRELARQFYPALAWCVEYNRRQVNQAGVIESDSDELEGRFPTGRANLCTSSLAYGGLLAAAWIADELGEPGDAAGWRQFAASLAEAIERYFGATIDGYATYRYYEGNTTLRSWLAIPLTMGLFARSEQTIAALFSTRLWTENGLTTEAGGKTFWDRATLYGLRGVFHAGEHSKAGRHFREYSQKRLLGEHVPYAVEAWPEGNQRHLSAESALYCRVVMEGIFGIVPTGFSSFSLKPSMPDDWPTMKLSHIRAFQNDFSVEVSRSPAGYRAVATTQDGFARVYDIPDGSQVEVVL